MKKRIKKQKQKLDYWLATDEGAVRINKKAFQDGVEMEMAVFRSREDAVDYVLESFSMKFYEMNRSLECLRNLLSQENE